jgi:signal peptidase II
MNDATDGTLLPGEGAFDDRAQADAHPARARRLEIWLPIVIVALDQLTKALVRARVPEHLSVTVIPGFMDFTHVRNAGAAFGFLNTADFPLKTVVIAVIATAALIGVGMYAASLAHHQFVARTGLALIIGGAAGNLIDRIVAGSVVDFVDVYWRSHHFWAFNVADSAITVGVAIMILDMLGVGTHASKTV